MADRICCSKCETPLITVQREHGGWELVCNYCIEHRFVEDEIAGRKFKEDIQKEKLNRK